MYDLIHEGWWGRRRLASVSFCSGQCADGGSIPWSRTQKRKSGLFGEGG